MAAVFADWKKDVLLMPRFFEQRSAEASYPFITPKKNRNCAEYFV
jgi:hypothetical protein